MEFSTNVIKIYFKSLLVNPTFVDNSAIESASPLFHSIIALASLLMRAGAPKWS